MFTFFKRVNKFKKPYPSNEGVDMTDNKENTPVTPKGGSNQTYLSGSPNSMKKALKPVSPNKNSNTYVGKLNFLQNDNFDEHFNHIHSVQDSLQQQLLGIEIQTKQTSVDVGELVDRLKNNNSSLNKVLNQIASYSDDVITEGYETKNQISDILSKLDEFSDFNSKNFPAIIEDTVVKSVMNTIPKLTPSFTLKDVENSIQQEFEKLLISDKNLSILDAISKVGLTQDEKASINSIKQLKEALDASTLNINKMLGSSESAGFFSRIEQLLSERENVSESKIREIFAENYKIHNEISQEILHNQKTALNEADMKKVLSENLLEYKILLEKATEHQNDGVDEETIRQIVSESSKANATLVDRILENQKGALSESTARSLIIDNFSEHKSLMQNFWQDKISDQLYNHKALSQRILDNQDHLAREASVQELLSHSSSVQEFTETIKETNDSRHSEILSKLAAIQETLPKRTLVNQIVEPIVKELSSVSLDAKSQKLLENIFDLLTSYQERDSSAQKQTLDLDKFEAMHSNINICSEKLEDISGNILHLKDKRIDELELELKRQTDIINNSLKCKDALNLQTELENKILKLLEKYEQMKNEYMARYQELVSLKQDYDDFLQNNVGMNNVRVDYNKTQKVRQLHLNKMRDLQVSKTGQTNSKRIVSSPLLQKNAQAGYERSSLPILDSE